MAKKVASRGGQYPIVAEFTFDAAHDTMKNVSGVEEGFGTAGTHVFEIVNFPSGGVVVGGEVVTELAVSGSTAYKIKIGDAQRDDRYMAETDRVAVGVTPLVPTGLVSNGGQIRMTVTPTGAATAGKVTVRVSYIVRNRVNEVQTH